MIVQQGPDLSRRAIAQRSGASATAVVAVVMTLVFLHNVAQGTRTLLRDGDSADQSFAWLSKIFAATHEHTVALWDFSVFSGTSFVGELQPAPFYPPAVMVGLFAHPGSVRAVDLFLLLHFAIAASGTMMLISSLGLSRLAGVAAAAVFAFGSTFAIRVGGQPNLFASLAWMPWLQWAVVSGVSARGTRALRLYAAAGAIFTALAFTAGHVHGVVLALVGAAILGSAAPLQEGVGAERAWTRIATALALLAFISALAAVLAAPQLVASNEYLHLSYKWYGPGTTKYPHVVPYEQFAAASLHRPDLATALSGQEVNALDGGTLFVTRAGLALAAAALIGALFVRRTRAATLAGAAMVGLGLAFAFSPVIGLGRLVMAVPVLNLIRLPARGLFLYASGMACLVAIGVDLLIALCRHRLRAVQAVAVVLTAAALGFGAWEIADWAPGVENRLERAPEVGVILEGPVGAALERLSDNAPLAYRYYGPRDLVPPNLGNIKRVLSANGYRSSRTMAYHDDFNFDPRRLDEYAVRWWVTDRPTNKLPVVATLGHISIQERPNALPVFWVAQGDSSLRPSIRDIAWEQNRVRVDFAQPVSGRLVFAQSVFPGWHAWSDGTQLPVVAHRGMLAIDLPAPATSVVFAYRPSWLWWTMLVSGFGIVIAGALVRTGVRRSARV